MKRGEVVEVDWQYTDMSGSKVRPAVVAQADFLNRLIRGRESFLFFSIRKDFLIISPICNVLIMKRSHPLVINLTPQLEAALSEQARRRGVAPEVLALDA